MPRPSLAGSHRIVNEPIVSREQIAEQAAADAREWIRAGRKGAVQNPFPALSTAAKLFDVALQRYLAGEREDTEASA
jgi:hypothetical protein